MQAFDYDNNTYSIREDIPEAFRSVWQTIASPGNWWTGEDRVALAAESRAARKCDFCSARKLALSPYNFKGEHHGVSNLPGVAIDAVHRITTDASRITKQWITKSAASGLSEEKYIELLGIVVAIISIDAFHRALGLPLETLPEPLAGEPSTYSPPGAKLNGAYIPTVTPADLSDHEADLYGGAPQTGNVLSAMSLVPDSVRMLTTLGDAQYLNMNDVPNPTTNGGRAISRPQIELIAGRVSSLSDCFY